MDYLVVYEWTGKNWSAYSPDVPGCVSVGDSREEVEANYQEALQLYLDTLQEEGLPIPQPTSDAGRVRVGV